MTAFSQLLRFFLDSSELVLYHADPLIDPLHGADCQVFIGMNQFTKIAFFCRNLAPNFEAHEPKKYLIFRKPFRKINRTAGSSAARFREYIWKYSHSILWSIWTRKISTICGISRLTLRISKCGFLIRQFLQLERPWSLDNTKLDPFAERVPASLVQDETVALTSSTSGHLDMGIGEDNQLERLITQNLAFRWTWSVDSAAILWILGCFIFWLNGENKNSLDL
ncbi:hypothetical protein RCL_jg22539.t1 [Rhizophagus clarus]|uniref:Uncharacterized protein n=1 Tax=Rhizophagus clarus TaxID=94130 RepID=A0A8H3R4Y6_9GLOM|nr:hypothetical protein RCL_jg22539.t1 [Rhizophagus clarus]